jgi:hypothetical protein
MGTYIGKRARISPPKDGDDGTITLSTSSIPTSSSSSSSNDVNIINMSSISSSSSESVTRCNARSMSNSNGIGMAVCSNAIDWLSLMPPDAELDVLKYLDAMYAQRSPT